MSNVHILLLLGRQAFNERFDIKARFQRRDVAGLLLEALQLLNDWLTRGLALRRLKLSL